MIGEKLYNLRFDFFFITQLALLFGSLVFRGEVFDQIVAPVLFLLNQAAGILLISKRKELFWFFLVLLLCSSAIFGLAQANQQMTEVTEYIEFGIYFAFYLLITYEIIRQVWYSAKVNRRVIIGMISGFICLGLVGFFIYMSIELTQPASFEGGLLYLQDSQPETLTEQLMYFSFITLLTIGYGDITPVTPLAQKASILIGLVGQFYLVIITAVVVGKFINQNNASPKE